MTWLMNFKDLNRRALADKLWHDKVFNIAKHKKYDGCHRGLLASMMYKFFDKKTSTSGIKNKEWANKLHKPFIRKFNKKN